MLPKRCKRQSLNTLFLKWLWPNDAILCHISWSTLVQVMARCLTGTKPLTESMVNYWQLHHLRTKFGEIWIKIQTFSLNKYIWNYVACKMAAILSRPPCVNTLRPRQNGRHFADAIFKCIFLNENVWIPVKIPLKFIPKGPINNIPALVQIMAWRRPSDKPLSEPMMVSLLTHICVTRPQWVKSV